MPNVLARSIAVLLGISMASVSTAAQSAPFRPEFLTLALGETAASLTTEGCEAFACGSNGGTPLHKIAGWTDFMKCAPEPNGLREVYVEFGRRLGQLAERFKDQYGEDLWIERFGGTRLANFPVVLSLLFDAVGIVRGFRAVTDSRAPIQDRGRAYLSASASSSCMASRDGTAWISTRHRVKRASAKCS